MKDVQSKINVAFTRASLMRNVNPIEADMMVQNIITCISRGDLIKDGDLQT